MPEQKSQVSVMTALSVLFTLIAIVAIVALVMLKSKADDATQGVIVTATAPSVDSVGATTDAGATNILAAGFTPTEAGTHTVTVAGTVSDPNGCTNIDSVVIKVYYTSAGWNEANPPVSSYSGAATLSGCTGVGDLDATYTREIDMANYAHPTDAGAPYAESNWTIDVTVTDLDALYDQDTGRTFEVNSLAAFSTAASIDYGTVALGAVSNEQTLTFVNTGNRQVDANVLADHDMTEASGNYDVIPVEKVKHSLTTGFNWTTGDGVAVSRTSATHIAMNLAHQTVAGTIPDENTYWLISMPSTGVNGTYHNALTLTASSSAGF